MNQLINMIIIIRVKTTQCAHQLIRVILTMVTKNVLFELLFCSRHSGDQNHSLYPEISKTYSLDETMMKISIRRRSLVGRLLVQKGNGLEHHPTCHCHYSTMSSSVTVDYVVLGIRWVFTLT